jgi:hypothetical protein
MLRCRIELLPGGDEARARTLGMVEIATEGISQKDLAAGIGVSPSTLCRLENVRGSTQPTWSSSWPGWSANKERN